MDQGSGGLRKRYCDDDSLDFNQFLSKNYAVEVSFFIGASSFHLRSRFLKSK